LGRITAGRPSSSPCIREETPTLVGPNAAQHFFRDRSVVARANHLFNPLPVAGP